MLPKFPHPILESFGKHSLVCTHVFTGDAVFLNTQYTLRCPEKLTYLEVPEMQCISQMLLRKEVGKRMQQNLCIVYDTIMMGSEGVFYFLII